MSVTRRRLRRDERDAQGRVPDVQPTEDVGARGQTLMLDLQRSVGNAAASRAVLARKKTKDAVESVGGEAGMLTFMPGGSGEENSTIAAGEKGFTLQMLKEVPVAAGKHFGDYADAHLHGIKPELGPLDRQLEGRAKLKQKADDEVNDWFTKHGIPSVLRIWKERQAGLGEQINQMTLDRQNEQLIAQEFNAGVPRANQMFVSLSKLEAMQEMLGVQDPAAMVAAVVGSLKDAQAIGEKRQLKGAAAGLDVPAADAQVSQSAGVLAEAQRNMATKWMGVQQSLTLKRAADIKEEGKADEERKKEIDENIETWKNIGSTIDVSMAVMGVDIAGETKGGGLRSFMETGKELEKEGGEAKKLKRIELPEGVKETKEAVSKAVGLEIPTSASALLEDAAKIYYFGELEKIRKHLAELEIQVSAHKAAAEALGLQKTLAEFRDAVDQFQHRAEDLQARLVARQMAYIKFGAELDEAAQQSHNAGAPATGHERFATVMAVTSAVREVLSIGRGAIGGFNRDSATLESEIRVIINHRELVPAHLDPAQFQLTAPDDELAPLGDALVQLRNLEANFKALQTTLAPIDDQAGALMTALNAGHSEAAGY